VVKALARVARRPLDVHLMITNPWQYADAFLDAGAASLSIHAELIQDAAGRERGRELLRRIRSRGARAAIAVNPETPLGPALPVLGEVDMVLVMSVRPGFGGQAFMPEVLDKVRALRATHGFQGDVEMDGGLARDTVPLCAAAGCNVFVAGSALFRAADMRAEIELFRRIVAGTAGGARADDGAIL
jgi:ribulose-phosphate 3-epimerase